MKINTLKNCKKLGLCLCVFASLIDGLNSSVCAQPDKQLGSTKSEIDSGGSVGSGVAGEGNSQRFPSAKRYFRIVPASLVDSLKRSKDFEYANDPAYLNSASQKTASSPTEKFWQIAVILIKIVVYTLIAVGVFFSLFRLLAESNLRLFYAKPTRLVVNKIDRSEEIPNNIDKLIGDSLQVKDYRKATRYMHLKALRILDKRGVIRYDASMTNHYYQVIVDRTKFGKAFRSLTNIFEHLCFGGFDLDDSSARIVKRDFDNFYSELGD